MTGPQSNSTKPAPWYKHRWPWILMSGPAAVVVAGFYTFYLAKTHADEMVTDDYYKEGKYINLQIERDEAAAHRHIQAQVLLNNDGTAAKIFISGDFDKNTPMQLLLLHPAKKPTTKPCRSKPATRRHRATKPNTPPPSTPCRPPCIGICGWKTRKVNGAWKANGSRKRAMLPC